MLPGQPTCRGQALLLPCSEKQFESLKKSHVTSAHQKCRDSYCVPQTANLHTLDVTPLSPRRMYQKVLKGDVFRSELFTFNLDPAGL